MARVVFAPSAVSALDALLATRELPVGARQRVLSRIAQLEQFPESGRTVESGPSAGARALTGPWWFITAYDHDEAADLVQIVAVLDGRTAAAEAYA